jgi:hypothetical protein
MVCGMLYFAVYHTTQYYSMQKVNKSILNGYYYGKFSDKIN